MHLAGPNGVRRRAMRATVIGATLVVATTMGTAYAALPSGATKLTASNPVLSGIDGHLHAAGSIAGKITAVAGGALSASVSVYRNGNFVNSGFSNSSGDYTVNALPAASNYKVCVSGTGVFSGGSSTTGYLGRCYKTAGWNGGSIPSTATSVAVTLGNTTPNINIKLPSAAAIAGKVTSSTGTALNGVFVTLHNRSNGGTFFATTNSSGLYKAKSLTAATKGYTVCFNPFGVTSGTTGYLPRCFHNVAWSGGALPSSATKVSVSLGHTKTKVNQALPRGGAISGTVTSAANGSPIAGDAVIVFNSKGTKFLGSASTNSKGHYKVKGLATATGDRVCAAPTSPSASVTFHGKCWKNIAYNGVKFPSGTNPVSVKTGKTHTGISFKLSKTTIKLGSITGTITDTMVSPNAIEGATVSLFTSTGVGAGTTSTSSSGQFTFSNLHASSAGYVVCATAFGAFSPTTSIPATGWAPRCYAATAWNGANVPAGAKRIPLSAGQHKNVGTLTLPVGGAIAGTTFVGNTGTPATGVTIDLYTAGGRFVNSIFSSFSDGTFNLIGLSTALNAYIVCYDGRFAFPTSYLPQCYNNQSWNGSA